MRWCAASLERRGGQLDVLEVAARQPADDRALHLARRPRATLSKSPREAAGKPASMTSTPSSASARATRSFSGRGHAAARGLLAIAQRGVEDQYSVGIGGHGALPMFKGWWGVRLAERAHRLFRRVSPSARACARAGSRRPSRSGGRRPPSAGAGSSALAGGVLLDPLARELAALHLLEHLAHLVLHALVDDARAAGEIAVLGGLADEAGASWRARPRAAGRRSASARAGTRSRRLPAGSRPRPASRSP